MEKILITGATGFLGEYLVRLLVKEYQVYALGRNVKKGRELELMGAVFCQGDFTEIDKCKIYFKGIDYVIHAGALSTPWGEWEDFYKTNVRGTAVVSRLCLLNGVKRLVSISSPSIYTEKRNRLGIREEQFDRKNDLNGYIKSKILAECEMHKAEKKGLETVILRPRGLIGIGDTSLVPRLLRANEHTGIPLFNGGRNQVDLTSVENVALACRLALTADGVSGQTFNITNGEPMEFREILESFLSAIGEKPKYRELPFKLVYGAAGVMEKVYRVLKLQGEPPLTRYTVCTLGFAQTLDLSKAKALLGYDPKKTLKESIEEYGRWWISQKSGMTESEPEPEAEPEPAAPGLIETVRLYYCGFCVNNLKILFKKHSSEKRRFPASAALICHKKYGNILFDTGYSEKLFLKDPLLQIYRRVNPVELKQSEVISEKIRKDQIDPDSIRQIILSHGHPDHIGGLTCFKKYQLIATKPVIQSLKKPSVKNLVFRKLLPKKGTIEGLKVLSHPVKHHFLHQYFDTIYDIFKDGSIYGVELEGHSEGQLGLWIPDVRLFLAADACWGSDLISSTEAMRWMARRIQNDFKAYKKTISRLERLHKDHPEIQIVFSHQQGKEQVYGRPSSGSEVLSLL